MAKKNDQIERYQGKRDFSRTPEPGGEENDDGAQPVFVIQEHDASNHHFDFRLEVDGVLKSWVIPKGPSTDPAEKRLAIPTEDHPVAYAGFEGVIPEDEYGAGQVIVWDRGTYENTSENDAGSMSMTEAIEEGHVTVNLAGQKISGGYALIRTGQGHDDQWLLMKMKDDEADARRNPVSTEPESVKTGDTIEDLRDGDDSDGQS